MNCVHCWYWCCHHPNWQAYIGRHLGDLRWRQGLSLSVPSAVGHSPDTFSLGPTQLPLSLERERWSIWEAWSAYPKARDAFCYIAEHPHVGLQVSVDCEIRSCYVGLRQDQSPGVCKPKPTNLESKPTSQGVLFVKRTLNNIHPMQEALLQNKKRVVDLDNVWSGPATHIPTPEEEMEKLLVLGSCVEKTY